MADCCRFLCFYRRGERREWAERFDEPDFNGRRSADDHDHRPSRRHRGRSIQCRRTGNRRHRALLVVHRVRKPTAGPDPGEHNWAYIWHAIWVWYV
ncbi:MAG TPA: hypothetical protein VLN58_07955 [Verrucomicrobiae bacterium]|nr:hypothetical protein [Verrucomicrobiae bacterium]